MGNPIMEMKIETVEHHFHLFEINGFFSLTLKKINFKRM